MEARKTQPMTRAESAQAYLKEPNGRKGQAPDFSNRREKEQAHRLARNCSFSLPPGTPPRSFHGAGGHSTARAQCCVASRDCDRAFSEWI